MGLRIVGLFAGIGGIEEGFHRAGHSATLLSEVDSAAQAVLAERFPSVELAGDVRDIDALPECDVVVAGFPCQDLSQAGRTAGIRGTNSGLVGEVFRLVRQGRPRWLVLENVPFMLRLDRGAAMGYLTRSLESLGFQWAYRIVDTRAFGLPQRRKRVLVVASQCEDPRGVLLAVDRGMPDPPEAHESVACGFYWTEGIRGLGWAVDAVPTLKGGSTIGIPSPPAIRLADTFIGLPDLRDAERLQGFPAGWTEPAEAVRRSGFRWKLVGNAVSVPVARWLGECLSSPRTYLATADARVRSNSAWPDAAWGGPGLDVRASTVSAWPIQTPYRHLADYLDYECRPLSVRASQGFLSRTERSSLRFPSGLLQSVRSHLERMSEGSLAA